MASLGSARARAVALAALASLAWPGFAFADNPAPAPASTSAAPPASAAAPVAAPPRVVAPAPPATAPAIGADWVAVTLESDDPHAALYAKEPHKIGVGDEVADSWSFVCLAPCGDRVDPRKAYRVMGEALVPSIEFNVAPGSGSIGVHVHARHPASPAVTATFAATGGVAAVGGILLLLLDLAEHGAAGALAAVPHEKKKLIGTADTLGDVGAGMLAGGVVFAGIALIYVATTGKTELTPAGSTTARPHADGPRLIPFGLAF